MNTMLSRITLWFLLAALSAVSSEYYEVGSTVVLRPQPVSVPITSITWKSNGDIVADWIKDKTELEYFGRFTDHAALEISTAVLTLKNVKTNHSGDYTVEINFQAQSNKNVIEILRPLQKPHVSVQPLACGPESDSCTLVCVSDVEGVGNVAYSWWKDGKEKIMEMSDRLIIVKEETKGIEYYTCKIKNPIKELESDKCKNPLYIPPDPVIVIVIVPVLIIVLIVFVASIVAFKKWDKLKSLCNTGDPSGEHPTHNGAGRTESQPLSKLDKSP